MAQHPSNSSRMQRIKRSTRTALLFSTMLFGIMFAQDLVRQRKVPDSVPTQQLLSINGSHYDLAALSADGPVLVYFWATWCPVCQLTSPLMSTFSHDYPVISIAMRSGEDEKLQQYITAKGYEFSVINDMHGQLTAPWHIGVTPTIAIVVNGKIVSVTSGVTTSMGLRARLWFYGNFN